MSLFSLRTCMQVLLPSVTRLRVENGTGRHQSAQAGRSSRVSCPLHPPAMQPPAQWLSSRRPGPEMHHGVLSACWYLPLEREPRSAQDLHPSNSRLGFPSSPPHSLLSHPRLMESAPSAEIALFVVTAPGSLCTTATGPALCSCRCTPGWPCLFPRSPAAPVHVWPADWVYGSLMGAMELR